MKTKSPDSKGLVTSIAVEHIVRSIFVLRGQKALLDADLAGLYGVTTKVLLQSVRRNARRFPPDFMMRLSESEWSILRSQFVTSKLSHGGRRYAPYAFTEQGDAQELFYDG